MAEPKIGSTAYLISKAGISGKVNGTKIIKAKVDTYKVVDNCKVVAVYVGFGKHSKYEYCSEKYHIYTDQEEAISLLRRSF